MRNRLKGDLDTIVLMALRKEPQRRYASAEQFSEDIRRHLDGLPVIAREDTFKYRTGKFVARNKLAVAAATIFVVLLAGFVITTLVQSRWIARERDRAQLERDKAEQVSKFLVELFKVSDPSESKGNQVTARELLDKSAGRIANELKDQPEVQAKLMDTMGQVYRGLGLTERAQPLLEKSLALRQQIFGNEHGEVADSLSSLMAMCLDKGDYEAGIRFAREALAIRRKARGNESREVADSLNDLGLLLLFNGEYEAAEASLRESLAIKRKLFGRGRPELIETLTNFGSVLNQNSHFEEAGKCFEEAVAIVRQKHGPEQPDTAIVTHQLATFYADPSNPQKDFAKSVALFEEALAVRRKILPADHPDIAFTLIDLANALVKKGDPAPAEPLARAGLEIVQKKLPDNPLRQNHARYVLGRSLNAQRKFAEAEPLLRQSHQGFKQSRGEKDYFTELCREELIKLYDDWNKPDKAAPYRAQCQPPQNKKPGASRIARKLAIGR